MIFETHLFIFLFIHLFICLFIYLFIYLKPYLLLVYNASRNKKNNDNKIIHQTKVIFPNKAWTVNTS